MLEIISNQVWYICVIIYIRLRDFTLKNFFFYLFVSGIKLWSFDCGVSEKIEQYLMFMEKLTQVIIYIYILIILDYGIFLPNKK